MRNQEYSRKSKLKSKKLAPANYLIVCEGKQTEPNYFNGLRKSINEKYGNKVDVLIPSIDIKGIGQNTTNLVSYADKFINYSNKRYGQVWLVFDKDDYTDTQFDKAIKNSDYNIAWSNPNFELWLLAHLKNITKSLSKDDALKELDKEFKINNLGKYKKNDTKVFEKLICNDGINKAIKNCKSMELINEKDKPSQRNPMTKVYKIIDGLKEYL